MRVLVCLTLVCAALATPWNQGNDPANVGVAFNYNLKSLPLTGTTPNQPWSDTYWPSSQSGIAHRWNAPDPQDFSYATYTKTQLLNMSVQALQQLSPAEKYDISQGRYDYPTVKSELSRTSPDDPGWEGLCHGWAPAALYYQQPNACTVKNADGIVVPFGSSDVKALLTYWTGMYDEQYADTWFVAGRCNIDIQANPQKENTSACADINAGSFHVILANMIGSHKSGFVVDRDRSIQVWNQPVFKYKTSIVGTGPSSNPRAANAVSIQTSMSYGKETYPQWNAHSTYVITENYQYTVDVDSNGNIIGGDHITWDRPDFEWMVTFNDFSGYFSGLQAIYAASTNQSHPATDADTPLLSSAVHAPLPRAVPTSKFRNHVALTAATGAFGVQQYGDRHRASWTIAPPRGAKKITLAFDSFRTRRFLDTVKVFEGADGTGALVAVLHGDRTPEPVEVHAGSALVIFTAKLDVDPNDSFGFSAVYQAHN